MRVKIIIFIFDNNNLDNIQTIIYQILQDEAKNE